jgi:hypothetical protein
MEPALVHMMRIVEITPFDAKANPTYMHHPTRYFRGEKEKYNPEDFCWLRFPVVTCFGFCTCALMRG